MTVIILGSNGQLGIEFKNYCKKQNIKFYSFSKKELDITNPGALTEKFLKIKPTSVINCAAYTKVDAAEKEKELAMQINGKAMQHISECCNLFDTQLIHFSTDYVFDGSLNKKQSYSPEYEPNPLNAYGETKFYGENMVKTYCKNYLIFRVSWVFSSHGANFVTSIFKKLKNNEDLKIVDDQNGSPTSVEEIVRVVSMLLGKKNKKTYHLSQPDFTTWYDFAIEIKSLLIELLDAPLESKILPIKTKDLQLLALRPENSQLNNTDIENDLDIKIISWKESLRNVLIDLKNEC